MIRAYRSLLLAAGLVAAAWAADGVAVFESSGDTEIDRVRREIAAQPTSPSTWQQRTQLLYCWLGALQQQGADTRAYFAADQEYYRLEREVNRLKPGPEADTALQALCSLIDRGFAEMESLQRRLREKGPIFLPRQGDPSTVPAGGDPEAEWPMFQANAHHTGASTCPGPRHGRLAWKFPVGLGWYSRPVIDGGRVYLASPGLRTTGFCLDLATGGEIWRSTQAHPLFGLYKYPAIASSPIVRGSDVLFREVNSHGGNEGQARHIVYLDKATGRTQARKYAGHIDYRTQYAPLAANEKFVVYPFGVHDIYGSPAICQNFNRLICGDRDNSRKLWDVNVGDIDALAEPVIGGARVFVGTMEGYVYALRLGPAPGASGPLLWNFRAQGAVNTSVAVAAGRIFFGSNGGVLYALSEETGEVLWQRAVTPLAPGARKFFSTVLVVGERLYVGAANKRVYCLDARDGALRWESEVSDWVRARPVLTQRGLLVATVDGRIHGLGARDGALRWSKVLSSHPIYADLAATPAIVDGNKGVAGARGTEGAAGASGNVNASGEEGRVVVCDSNLYAYGLDFEGGLAWRKSLLPSFTLPDGGRIFTDQLSGGTYYQSKPTAHRGKLFFGTPAGFLHAVEARSGREVWRFEMGGGISVGPACAEGRVYAGQQGGERFFYCLDADTGALIWKQTLPGGWVWGSATVHAGRVFVPTVSGYAVALDARTGHILWMYPTAKSVPAEPAIEGNLVYFGSWSRSLYAFDQATGEMVWKNSGTVALDSGTLIALDGKIHVPHHANIFSTFDARTGQLLSPGNTDATGKGAFSDFNATPAFHEGRAFFSARGGMGLRGVPLFSTVYCVDPATAKILWTHPDGGGLSAPAVANGRVYIGSGNTPLFYCLDARTGAVHWVYRLGHRIEESTLCLYQDRVFALAADGYVHAIE